MRELSDVDVAEMLRVIDIERDGLADLFERIASERQYDPEAATDPRFAEAATSIRKIAATLGDLGDVFLLNFARLDQASGGMAASPIAARLLAVGFGIGPYDSAAAFFEPFADIIEHVSAGGRMIVQSQQPV